MIENGPHVCLSNVQLVFHRMRHRLLDVLHEFWVLSTPVLDLPVAASHWRFFFGGMTCKGVPGSRFARR